MRKREVRANEDHNYHGDYLCNACYYLLHPERQEVIPGGGEETIFLFHLFHGIL